MGGNPHGRGVVSTANYLAREFGIHSAMSCAEAMRRCPQAVFVPPRHSVYREYSRAVWDAVRHVVPTVERTGLDEGYLDIGEVAPDFLAARRIAEAVQAAVRGATSLSASLGVAPCKVVAKVASDWRKPGRADRRTGRARGCISGAVRRSASCPASGRRSEERLRAAGLETIGQLAALDDDELRRLLPGKAGRMLHDRARGIDPRGLEHAVERISVSHEETFERDVADTRRAPRRAAADGGAAGGAPVLPRRGRADGHDEGALPGLRHPQPLDDAGGGRRRRGDDRRRRVPAARPGAPRPRGPLRLVGVGLSNIEPFRQLALTTP